LHLKKTLIDTRKKAVKIIVLLCGKNYDGMIKKRKGTYWYISVDDDGDVHENSVYDIADNYIDDFREALEEEEAEYKIERENEIYGDDEFEITPEMEAQMDRTDEEME
jgi:hypothetical protein